MPEQLTADDSHLQKVIFFKAIFHTRGVVNCRIWGGENPHALMEHVHNSPKVEV
jgi:hypothetical protein